MGPVDLEIKPGELLFVVGGNGSGKTTFAKVLCGLYEPNAGVVKLDGALADAANRIWYAQHFGTVFAILTSSKNCTEPIVRVRQRHD